jgi:uncharacterized protein YoxC
VLLLANILFALALVGLGVLLIQQQRNQKTIISIMAENQSELAQELRDFKTTVSDATGKVLKGTTEMLNKIKRLEEIIAAGGPITQELKDLAASLKTDGAALTAAAQAADDVVPDEPAT